MNTEQTTPVPLTQKEWVELGKTLADQALRRVKQFPEEKFGGGENWKTSYPLGYAEAAQYALVAAYNLIGEESSQ